MPTRLDHVVIFHNFEVEINEGNLLYCSVVARQKYNPLALDGRSIVCQ